MPEKQFFFVFLYILLLVTACQTSGTGRSSLSSSHVKRSTYLSHGYGLLARYEEFITGDLEAASHFSYKKDLADARKPVTPDKPNDVKISGDLKLEADLKYNIIIDALDTLDNPDNAGFLAQAQLNYDCWIKRVQSKKRIQIDDHEKGCHELFYKSIDQLVLEKQSLYKVYFDSNSVLINEQALSTINKVAGKFVDRPQWNLHLVGHSDSKGSYAQNVVLSMRRAVAIKNAIAQHGVDPDKIIIDAVGESGTEMMETDDMESRRVDIAIVPSYLHQNLKGPNIHKIFPNHFKAQDGHI